MQISRNYRRMRCLSTAVAAAALLSATDFTRGINITMSYDAAGSSPPAADPGGAQLQAIMNYVRGVYNDIFEDTHNITITYRWGTPSNPGAIAAHSLVSQGGTPNRETAGTIVFRNTTAWFFDPTPADNSEFNMTQTLWRDLTATQRNNFYSNFGANIPSTFEAGFTGTDNGSDPNVSGNIDILSTAFHEVGHALGMSASNNATIAETGDNDYDFDTAFVFGQALAAWNCAFEGARGGAYAAPPERWRADVRRILAGERFDPAEGLGPGVLDDAGRFCPRCGGT